MKFVPKRFDKVTLKRSVIDCAATKSCAFLLARTTKCCVGCSALATLREVCFGYCLTAYLAMAGDFFVCNRDLFCYSGDINK